MIMWSLQYRLFKNVFFCHELNTDMNLFFTSVSIYHEFRSFFCVIQNTPELTYLKQQK
jgi:hypothetical protein